MSLLVWGSNYKIPWIYHLESTIPDGAYKIPWIYNLLDRMATTPDGCTVDGCTELDGPYNLHDRMVTMENVCTLRGTTFCLLAHNANMLECCYQGVLFYDKIGGAEEGMSF